MTAIEPPSQRLRAAAEAFGPDGSLTVDHVGNLEFSGGVDEPLRAYLHRLADDAATLESHGHIRSDDEARQVLTIELMELVAAIEAATS